MDRGKPKTSRMRNTLALLLMVVAAVAAGRTHARNEAARVNVEMTVVR
jgi:hypothetical protein